MPKPSPLVSDDHERIFDWAVFEERAAIMEYDGDLTRDEAEFQAAKAQGFHIDAVRRWIRRAKAAQREERG